MRNPLQWLGQYFRRGTDSSTDILKLKIKAESSLDLRDLEQLLSGQSNSDRVIKIEEFSWGYSTKSGFYVNMATKGRRPGSGLKELLLTDFKFFNSVCEEYLGITRDVSYLELPIQKELEVIYRDPEYSSCRFAEVAIKNFYEDLLNEYNVTFSLSQSSRRNDYFFEIVNRMIDDKQVTYTKNARSSLNKFLEVVRRTPVAESVSEVK
ncbi:MAG: hypothetical protein Q8O89_08480 [Nanoarchaeota archaeon]|nr:hypothetical protein [Nanoarchaeota archaeon]